MRDCHGVSMLDNRRIALLNHHLMYGIALKRMGWTCCRGQQWTAPALPPPVKVFHRRQQMRRLA